jgi:hypothetical protein
VFAYLALFAALAGTSVAATSLVRAVTASHKPSVKITCKATRAKKKVSCKVVGTAPGKAGPRGPKGAHWSEGRHRTVGHDRHHSAGGVGGAQRCAGVRRRGG